MMVRCPNAACGSSVSEGLDICPLCGTALKGKNNVAPGQTHPLDYGTADPPEVAPAEYLEISLGRAKKWWGFIAYIILFIVVASVLTAVFAAFGASWKLAICLVSFMVAYMLITGMLASRNLQRIQQDDRLMS